MLFWVMPCFWFVFDAMAHEKKVKNVLLAVRLHYATGKAPSLRAVFIQKSDRDHNDCWQVRCISTPFRGMNSLR